MISIAITLALRTWSVARALWNSHSYNLIATIIILVHLPHIRVVLRGSVAKLADNLLFYTWMMVLIDAFIKVLNGV